MFVNTHVFINSSVVYKLWWGGGGRGGLGEGSWNISSRVPPPSPASPQVRRYGIYGSHDVVRNCNCTVWSFVYK